ncbi:YbcC family protein [Rhodopirellula sp. SWK7]|uniref:YbcC family protein n=1 Tax=Rhodopirellula sp. SWK7 TaxID=595460 RepID=UPI000344DD97|nr:DUF2309 domain-containing protein [Rhodopirellula sp. SWK7]
MSNVMTQNAPASPMKAAVAKIISRSEPGTSGFGTTVREALKRVSDVIAPVWPLRDYVAVNPYAGLSANSFLEARSLLQSFSDCETLMGIEYYRDAYREGRFTADDIAESIKELAEQQITTSLDAQDICDLLAQNSNSENPGIREQKVQPRLRTIAEIATTSHSIDWSEAIRDEVSKHCAAHYDEGESVWASPVAHLSLYQAWRTVAPHDRNIEILGLRGIRQFIAKMPAMPETAITELLTRLNVPQPLWSSFLLCQAFSIPGWSAWTKYQTNWKGNAPVSNDSFSESDLVGLLAIRLAYDVALAESESIEIDLSGLVDKNWPAGGGRTNGNEEAVVRLVLLRASEIAFRNNLLDSMSEKPFSPHHEPSDLASPPQRKLAQMVFCIDVRSERIRRQLESLSDQIDTLGFAGFFGMPIQSVSIGQTTGDAHVPVLIKPKFKLHEGLPHQEHEPSVISKRKQTRTWRQTWNEYSTSGIGCFSFVESTGLLYGWKLASRAFGKAGSNDHRYDAVPDHKRDQLGPTLRGLNHQGITLTQQADLAESMLRNMGLTEDFASLVVFCGHASQTDNNPLAAGLDCGACGGHSGEPNARLAAMLLNQHSIRTILASRGIMIPDDTHFVAGLHNTATDSITFFHVDDVPESHRDHVQQLTEIADNASEQTRLERLPIVASDTVEKLIQRAGDWSEVRPEWALAGNAAFIVAPRSLTRDVNLNGRSFLHSYDWQQDPEGKILESIMTAPMVVAHWINMQYYASTVDNAHFGSGCKTVHNVVGRFGILSGNGGDLMTGLPWQSVHTGSAYQHAPMRLQVIIAAPLESIDRVLQKHLPVAELVEGGWLHLVAIHNGVSYQRAPSGDWSAMPSAMPSACNTVN